MRVLAFKGGGVRGLVSAKLAHRLDQKVPGWAAQADLVAGSSVGAINACAVSAGVPWADVVRLFRMSSKRIFADSAWDNLKDLNLNGVAMRGAQYGSKGLRDVLEETFGNKKLGDLPGPRVLIPTFDLDNRGQPRTWKPKFFSTDHDPFELVVDVLMRTTAAPTYFPVHQGYVDGGVVANDPTVCAIAEILRGVRGTAGVAEELLGLSVLTIGTGQVHKYIEGEDDKDWGALQWARNLLNVVMDGGLMAPLYQTTTLLGPRHYHLDPVLPREIALDGDAWRSEGDLESSLKELETVAKKVDLEEALAWLRCRWVRGAEWTGD